VYLRGGFWLESKKSLSTNLPLPKAYGGGYYRGTNAKLKNQNSKFRK